MSWFDDVVAHAYSKTGEKTELTLRDVYGTQLEMLKIAYFDFMVRVEDADYKRFKSIHMKACSQMMDVLESKYADHVEGIKRKSMEKNNG